MTVAVDVTGTVKSQTTSVTTFNYTGITVGSGSNRALIFMLAINGGGVASTGATATWDSGATNQAMTLLKSVTYGGANHGSVWLFGLRNPISGNKTLAVSWTGTNGFAANAISFTGVDQTSDATAFPNSASNTNTSGTLTLAITSASGNIPVTLGAAGTISAPNQTQIYLDAVASDDSGGQRAAGAATVTFTWTNGSTNWGMVGCDVAQVAAATNPLNPTDRLPGSTIRRSGYDLSVALNPNIFTNPYPFNTYDYPKVWDIRQAPFDLSVGLNPNLFKNPVPIFNGDGSSSKLNPDWAPAPPPPLNINLFTNPFPFNQYDWSKPVKIAQAPFAPQIGINPNLFTNPVPILNQFGPGFWEPRLPNPDQPYNQNLYAVTVVATPFVNPGPTSFAVPDFQPAPPPPLNINLFTNPYPFQNQFGPVSGVASVRLVDQPYNPNLYSAVVSTTQPFNQTFWPPAVRIASAPVDFYNIVLITNTALPFSSTDLLVPFRPRAAAALDQPYNPNLYTAVVAAAQPFLNQFVPTTRIRALPQPDQAYNPNLFTNPYPIQNVDVRLSRSPAFPLLDQTYNVNLYGTVAVAALPFNPTDQFRTARPIYSSSPDVPYNQRLFTNPVPFNQFDYPKTKRTAQAPVDLSFAPNLSLFKNPIPFLNVGTPSVLSVRGTPSPDIAYNQSLYTVIVVPTPFNSVDWARPFFPKTLPLFDQGLNPNLFTGAARIDELDVTILSGTIVATISTGTIGETILAGSLVTNVSVGTVATTILSGTLIANITE